MVKLYFAALLTATAVAVLQIRPAARAHATSPSCAKAIELINAAIDVSGGTMDDATTRALSDRPSGVAVLAVGEPFVAELTELPYHGTESSG